METVKLRNGSEELAGAVAVLVLSLRSLMERHGVVGICALYDIGKLALDPKHAIADPERELLLRLALVTRHVDDSLSLHDITRNVVQSAVVFEDGMPTLVDPRAPATQQVVLSADLTGGNWRDQ